MERGHVKLWRKSIDSSVFQNQNIWKFWTWALMKASWNERDILFNTSIIRIFPGQFIFGRLSASKSLNMTERVIRTCIDTLVKLKKIDVKTTNKYSIITIINWNSYQPSDQQDDQQTTSKRPANDQQTTTKKKLQEVKELEENNILSDSPESDQKGKIVYPDSFERFWAAYPKKEGKGAAFKAYQKIKAPRPTLKQILDSIEIHKKTNKWMDKQFIPQPATFLNQRRWEDEFTADDYTQANPFMKQEPIGMEYAEL